MAFGRKKQQSSTEISREELTRTQVLNLQELERVANYEQKTSKRPAALFAFAGFLAIALGLLYPNIMMAVDSIGAVDNTSYRVNIEDIYQLDTTPVVTSKMICTLTQLGLADGTDRIYTTELFFQEQKLQTYVKTLNATPIAGNPNAMTTIQAIYSNYTPFSTMPINGYNVLITTTENSGTKVEITIDLKTLDKTQLTYNHASNGFTNVEYELNADQTAIQNTLTAAGYVCTQQ